MGEVTRLGGLIGGVSRRGGLPGLPDRVTFLTSINLHFSRCLLAIDYVYELSDHQIILRKSTHGWRACKIACKRGLFFTPPKLVTSTTWGPHLHLNRT